MIVLPSDIADQFEIADEDVHAARVGRLAAPQPLGLEVVHVGLPRANEEVIRIDATPLVAAVADHAALGDRPVHADPGQAMR
jgi:hypothetical protein